MAYIIDDSLGPVGTYKTANMTEAQFQASHGPGWILADGRNVAGSVYAAKFSTTTVPDARGLILRGQNNGRADGHQNPDGTLLGVFQDHATAKNGLSMSDPGHTHATSGSATYSGGGPMFLDTGGNAQQSAPFNKVSSQVTTNISLGTGDNETRMRNMTVNHFIRIN